LFWVDPDCYFVFDKPNHDSLPDVWTQERHFIVVKHILLKGTVHHNIEFLVFDVQNKTLIGELVCVPPDSRNDRIFVVGGLKREVEGTVVCFVLTGGEYDPLVVFIVDRVCFDEYGGVVGGHPLFGDDDVGVAV